MTWAAFGVMQNQAGEPSPDSERPEFEPSEASQPVKDFVLSILIAGICLFLAKIAHIVWMQSKRPLRFG